MRFTLREATAHDVAALAALHVQTFRETHGGGPTLALRESQWQRILSDDDPADFTFVVQENADELVGFARGTRHDGGIPPYEGELDKGAERLLSPEGEFHGGYGWPDLTTLAARSRVLRAE